MGKNVAVFVDVANIFYAAKAAGVDIDYVTLLKSATAGRDFVRAYAYTGLDPDNENQRNFHQFLARHSYKVVSKDIRKYGDGKVKANLDIELVVDMMKTARNLDVAVIVSGDGDFAPAIRAVQEMGVRVEVISFRGNTSSDLIEAADLFTDITHIAKVDKSSTRSGRRVADDDEDLSMTEVPDKMTEGTGRGRGGRGRGRGRDRDEGALRSRTRDRDRDREEVVTPVGGGQLVALPGEKLSRAGAIAATPDAESEPGETRTDADDEVQGDAEARRRRRRRGGRGRGRGRREELGVDVVDGELPEGQAAIEGEPDVDDEDAEAPAVAAEAEEVPERPAARGGRGRSAGRTPSGELPTPFDDLDALASTPRAPKSTPFGSVWDRQLGTPVTARAAADLPPLDEDDIDEPEIPEYLLAERRRGQGGQGAQGGRGGRGGGRGGARSAYAAAIERERYGGSRGTGTSRFADPQRSGQGGRSAGGGRGGQLPPRGGRPDRVERAPRGTGGEEWSEVPPELEELLRAQMQRSRPAPAAPEAAVAETAVAETATPAPRRRTSARGAAAPESAPGTGEVPAEAPKRRAPRRTPAPVATESTDTTATPVAEAPVEAPKRRTTRRSAAPADVAAVAPAAEAPAAEAPAAAPRRRTTRKASTADAPAETPVEAVAEPVAEAAPKRRTSRRKAADAEG